MFIFICVWKRRQEVSGWTVVMGSAEVWMEYGVHIREGMKPEENSYFYGD